MSNRKLNVPEIISVSAAKRIKALYFILFSKIMKLSALAAVAFVVIGIGQDILVTIGSGGKSFINLVIKGYECIDNFSSLECYVAPLTNRRDSCHNLL